MKTIASINLELYIGAQIHDVLFEMLALAKKTSVNVVAEFNGIHVTVHPDDTYQKVLVRHRQMGKKYL